MTEPRVHSPYGKHVPTELRTVYGFDDVHSLATSMREQLALGWGLRGEIEEVHVAFGIAMLLRVGHELYYLKLASTREARAPEGLFALLELQRTRGLPVVEVVPDLRGRRYAKLLQDSPYDMAYVMRAVSGGVLASPTRGSLEAYAATLAALHRAGEKFEPRLPRARRALIDEEGLPATHLHGDPRLCHVLFENGVVTGLIDPDQAVWGARLVDVARAAVSHADPANAGQLDPVLIREFIAAYDREAGLTVSERARVPEAMRAAVAEAVSDVRHFREKNPSRITEADVARVEALREVSW